MGSTRRSFVKHTTTAAAAITGFAALPPAARAAALASAPSPTVGDPNIRKLAALAFDARTIPYTGLTRDGTFLIENGKIDRAVKNLRFDHSPVFMLNQSGGRCSADQGARS